MKAMKRLLLLSVCLIVQSLAVAYSSAADPTPGKQVPQSVTLKTADGTRELHYLLFLPKGYDASDKTKQWPLMLFLHGSGERGDDLEKVKMHGPPKIVEAKPDFEFIVVSPQCPKDSRWQASELVQLLDDVLAKHAVDPNRQYVTGLSMGGSGTWQLSAAQPQRFAAIAPICGRADLDSAPKIKHIPTWVFHGAKDSPASVEHNKAIVAALKAAGGEPKFTLYPDAGHDSWTESYNNPEFYTWLLAQRKQ
jgi:predicted peptidase